jgi:hypothetical protein
MSRYRWPPPAREGESHYKLWTSPGTTLGSTWNARVQDSRSSLDVVLVSTERTGSRDMTPSECAIAVGHSITQQAAGRRADEEGRILL